MCVIGLGYLGATHALAMAKLGHHVVGIDLDSTKVESMNAGKMSFHEPGLEVALREALSKELVRFQASFEMTEPAEVFLFASVHLKQALAVQQTRRMSLRQAKPFQRQSREKLLLLVSPPCQ